MMPDTEVSAIRPRLREWLAALLVSVGLVLLFWWKICPWNGGTLIGGDLFSYYFPQKAFLSDSLRNGEIPLWNHRVGAGYPVIAESQTGVLYPPTLLVFMCLDLNAAYHANQLLHFVVAFVGFWAFARWMGIRWWGAILGAVVFVYGWFAPRICLEWAIIGGAWMPWIFLCVEDWCQTGRRRRLLWLGPLMGGFLLAGHFHLAFITTLALGGYVPVRSLWQSQRTPRGAPFPLAGWRERAAWPLGVLVVGYLLAAVQLVPTMELMLRSQRSQLGNENDPGYGHIPPWYLTQVFSLWVWNGPEMNPDLALFQGGRGAYPVATNRVEAHLYFGMVPLILCAAGLVHRWRSGKEFDRRFTLWVAIGLIGVLVATGWPFLVLKHVPGFAYFRGAGRYGVLMAVAVGLCAGAALDRLFIRSLGRAVMGLVICSLTVWDLYSIEPMIGYAQQLDNSVVDSREQSQIGQLLVTSEAPARLWAPGQNVATVLPVSAWPVYLGLGPQEYFAPDLMTQYDRSRDGDDPQAVGRHLNWLWLNGVTHILSQTPLDAPAWAALEPALSSEGEFDPFFARVWGRFQEPVYLYRFQITEIDEWGIAGRVSHPVTSYEQSAQQVAFTVELNQPATVELRELAYPGWSVTVDDQPAEPVTERGHYRGVQVPAGKHRVAWRYRPNSLVVGAVLSVAASLVWIMIYRKSSGDNPVSEAKRASVT